MASCSGNSPTSTKFQSSGAEEELQVLIDDERKNKRKQSNRESARRSRMRKQNHLDDLMKQVSQFTRDNREILKNIDITTQHYLNIEAENSILRAQIGELNQRLESLNDIIIIINHATTTTTTTGSNEKDCYQTSAQNFTNIFCFNQPITTSTDIFQW